MTVEALLVVVGLVLSLLGMGLALMALAVTRQTLPPREPLPGSAPKRSFGQFLKGKSPKPVATRAVVNSDEDLWQREQDEKGDLGSASDYSIPGASRVP